MTGEAAVQTSVVLPVWDDYVVSDRLSEAWRSLQGQGVPVRVIVVDNASAVALPELPGAELVRSTRRLTLGAARNLGLARVSTPYVVFWDADDVMLPGTLERLEATIAAHPRLAAAAMAIVEEPSGARHRWPRRWIGRLIHARRLFALVNCVWSIYPTTGATIMRAELAQAGGGYSDAESGEDWCLGVSLGFRGRLGWSERPGRLYRIHDTSIWARHMDVRHQLLHARTVRHRIRTDPGIPGWVQVALPLIGLGQVAAIGAHVLVAALRGVKR